MTFVEECKAAAGPVWERWMHHPWTEDLFAGTLSLVAPVGAVKVTLVVGSFAPPAVPGAV